MRIELMFFAMCVSGIFLLAVNIGNIKSALQNARQHREEDRNYKFQKELKKQKVKKIEALVERNEKSTSSPSARLERFSAFPPTLVNNTDINPTINDFFTIKDGEKKDKFINLHQYNFSLNTNICTGGKIFLAIVVHSAPEHIEKRTIIRSTYGSVHSYKGRQLGVVFMLGSVDNPKVQQSLINESKTFGDIVQGNFHDSYRNLSRKHVMGMHWYLNHCSSEFVLKVDDDTFLNPFRMVDFLVDEPFNETMLHCYIRRGEGPVRHPLIRYSTSEAEYPFPVFPPFCIGFAYIASPKAWEALYRASEDRRILRVDDVFVSVILSLKANIGKVDLKHILQCKGEILLAEHIETAILLLDRPGLCWKIHLRMWKILLERMKQYRRKMKIR